MSHQAVDYVLAQNIKSSPQKLLMVAIAYHVDVETGRWTLKQRSLMKRATMSESQVRLHTKALEKDTRIIRHERRNPDGSQAAYEYEIVGYAEWMSNMDKAAISIFEAARGKLQAVENHRLSTGGGNPTHPPSEIRPTPPSEIHRHKSKSPSLKSSKSNMSEASLADECDLFSGGGKKEETGTFQADQEAKPKKRRMVGYTAGFEKCWLAFPARSRMSKAAAFKSWQRESCEDESEIIHSGVLAYKAQVKKDGTEDRHVKHMQGWLSDRRWECYGISAEDERDQQIKAVALDLAQGHRDELQYAAKWWKSIRQVPAMIMDAARTLMASWQPEEAFA